MIPGFLSLVLGFGWIELAVPSCPWDGAPVHGLMELGVVLLQIEGEFLEIPMAHALDLLGPQVWSCQLLVFGSLVRGLLTDLALVASAAPAGFSLVFVWQICRAG